METYNSQEFADYFNECRYVDEREKSDDSLDEDYKSEGINSNVYLYKFGTWRSRHIVWVVTHNRSRQLLFVVSRFWRKRVAS